MRRADFAFDLAVGVSLLAAPLVVFLRFHGYPLLRPEVALLGALCLGAAGLAALACRALPALRVPTFAAGVCWLVDLQASASVLELAALFAGLLLAARPLGRAARPLARAGAPAFALASLLLPVGHPATGPARFDDTAPARSPLPPLLVVVLDEHIGIEGLPARFDPGGGLSQRLRDVYLRHGFRVFRRAYSRHALTVTSFSALANRAQAQHWRPSGDGAEGFRLTRNALFEGLEARGYDLRVLQTDYLDLCSPAKAAPRQCSTTVLEDPTVLADSGIASPDVARVIVGMLLRRSALAGAATRWSGLRLRRARVSALSAMRAFDRLESEAAALGPGRALFAHLMLPHFPYVYDADCTLRPDPATWTNGEAMAARPADEALARHARRLYYRAYLRQLRCTARRVEGVLDAAAPEAHIVVLSDHGSRQALHRPWPRNAARLTPQDFADSFSSLFAMRRPPEAAGEERRLLPIYALLERAVSGARIPDAANWQQPPRVVLRRGLRDPRALEVRLPAFGRNPSLTAGAEAERVPPEAAAQERAR